MWAFNDVSYDDDYLAHYGVKGMKWGIRRNKMNYRGRNWWSRTVHGVKDWSKDKRTASIYGSEAKKAALGYRKANKKLNRKAYRGKDTEFDRELNRTLKSNMDRNINRAKAHSDKLTSKYGAKHVKPFKVKYDKKGYKIPKARSMNYRDTLISIGAGGSSGGLVGAAVSPIAGGLVAPNRYYKKIKKQVKQKTKIR